MRVSALIEALQAHQRASGGDPLVKVGPAYDDARGINYITASYRDGAVVLELLSYWPGKEPQAELTEAAE